MKGYRDAMTYVLQLADDPDAFGISIDLLRALHYMMLSHDLARRPGRWRRGPIYVIDDHTGERVCEGPPAHLVPELMGELVGSLDSDEPAIVRAAMAHLNLVMVHPFGDGNGRLGRALQTMVLAQDRILSPEFCSVEEFLGRQTREYHAVLAEVGGGSWQPHRNALPWLRFMLTAQYSQAMTLLKRVRVEQLVWDEIERLLARTSGVPERAVPALAEASAGFKMRRPRYVELAEVEEATATRDLARLVAAGLLVARGEKRGRFYIAAPQLRQIHATAREAVGGFAVIDPFKSPRLGAS